MKLKMTPADKLFSRCVRERANWACERCGNTPDPQGLHCSHYIGRGNWSVRFDPDNAFAHCYGCHMKLGADKHMFEEHYLEVFGMKTLDAILRRKENTNLGRIFKKAAGKKGDRNAPLTVHFRDELKRLETQRAEGVTWRLEFRRYL